MAHKKGVGSSRNGRDSNAQRLGLKKFGGERVLGGNILARQRGTKWKPGKNVGRGTKLIVFKWKRRKQYKRTQGHRQNYTTVKIDSIG